MTNLALDNLEDLVVATQNGNMIDRAIALGAAAMLARFLKESGEIDSDSYARTCRLFSAAEAGLRREVEV